MACHVPMCVQFVYECIRAIGNMQLVSSMCATLPRVYTRTYCVWSRMCQVRANPLQLHVQFVAIRYQLVLSAYQFENVMMHTQGS